MADKQIFELPDITLGILNSGVDISFVAQVEGYGLDFQVPSDVLLQYIGGNYQIGVSGGSSTPDNASGANGDIYFKSNGVVYQKISGAWVLKANITLGPASVTQTVNTGAAVPYVLTSPQLSTINAMGRYPIFGAFIDGVNFSDISVDYNGSPGAFTSASVNLHQDGGLNLDTTFLQFS